MLLNHLLLFLWQRFKFFCSHAGRYHSWNYSTAHSHVLIAWIKNILLRWNRIKAKLLAACQLLWRCSSSLRWKHTLTRHKFRNILLLNASCFRYHHRFFHSFSSQRFHKVILILLTLRHHCTLNIISTFHTFHHHLLLHLLLLMHLLIRYQFKYLLLCHTWQHSTLFFFWHSHLRQNGFNWLVFIHDFHLSLQFHVIIIALIIIICRFWFS